MKLVYACLLLTLLLGCQQKNKPSSTDEALEFAVGQTKHMIDTLSHLQKDRLPKSVDKQGRMTQSDIYDWTSGFFPGTLWYLYEYSKDTSLKKQAEYWTALLKPVQYFSGHHDVGFMINCSYGNAYRITGDTAYRNVMIQAAKSLLKRFHPEVGLIQSWNVDQGMREKKGWQYPVIVDNMMNLELLFKVFQFTGDSSFYNVAISHADKTMANHFRPDYSSYHVVDYDPKTGEVLHRQTAQGYADSSAWARGQTWGLYGYTMCYGQTGLKRYLEQARRIAHFILNHPHLPEDKVPYWDFNAPDIPNANRDVSSAAILASGLLDLAEKVDEKEAQQYRQVAETILQNLSKPPYRAALGTNQGFILQHSVGSIPHGSEIDVPLMYADYYYIEGLLKLLAVRH